MSLLEQNSNAERGLLKKIVKCGEEPSVSHLQSGRHGDPTLGPLELGTEAGVVPAADRLSKTDLSSKRSLVPAFTTSVMKLTKDDRNHLLPMYRAIDPRACTPHQTPFGLPRLTSWP